VPAQPLNGNNHEVKYVIVMVSDGMGLTNVAATRLRLANGNPALVGIPLNLETLEHVGYQRTYPKTNTVTVVKAALKM
jgi:alkaline phosphatase